jgi:hypothetical protein
MRAADAMAIGLLQRVRGHELTARTWPKTPPENDHPTLPRLLKSLFAVRMADGRVGVAPGGGAIGGLVVARPRATGIDWDVEHLIAADAATAVDLLSWACDSALAAAGRRVFLETPMEGLGVDAARRAGFEPYSEGATYRLDPGFNRDAPDALQARPRLAADEQGLFQVYGAAVPAKVRAAEAMTYDEWKGLYRGRSIWAPSLLGNRQDFVWQLGPRIIGWMRIAFGQRSQSLDLLIHPDYESYAGRMVRGALTQMSPKVPVLVDVREYDAGARIALEQAGFLRGPEYTVWVRQLAGRVREPSVAIAQVPV